MSHSPVWECPYEHPEARWVSPFHDFFAPQPYHVLGYEILMVAEESCASVSTSPRRT